MLDALRRYAGALAGFAEIPRQRAEQIATALAKQGLISSDQARALATDLVRRSRANRERLRELLRKEMPRLGVASQEELERLRQRVTALEANQRAARASAPRKAPASGSLAGRGARTRTSARRSPSAPS